MAYLIAQISLFLLLALAVGAVVGWFVRGTRLDRMGGSAGADDLQLERARATAKVARAELAAKAERLSQVEQELAEARIEIDRLRRHEVDEPRPRAAVLSGKRLHIEVDEVLAAASLDGAPTAGDAAQESSMEVAVEPPGGVAPLEDLSVIRGIGPATAKLLKRLGYTTVQHIAAWDETDIEKVVAAKKTLKSRIERDGWVEQARNLVG